MGKDEVDWIVNRETGGSCGGRIRKQRAIHSPGESKLFVVYSKRYAVKLLAVWSRCAWSRGDLSIVTGRGNLAFPSNLALCATSCVILVQSSTPDMHERRREKKEEKRRRERERAETCLFSHREQASLIQCLLPACLQPATGQPVSRPPRPANHQTSTARFPRTKGKAPSKTAHAMQRPCPKTSIASLPLAPRHRDMSPPVQDASGAACPGTPSPKTVLTTVVAGSRYLIHPQVLGTIQETISPDAVLPVTLLEPEQLYLHLEGTLRLFDAYDDVFTPEFGNVLVEKPSGGGAGGLRVPAGSFVGTHARSVMHLRDDTHTRARAVSDLPAGPYILHGPNLHQAWKIYLDTLDAFAFGVYPTTAVDEIDG